MCKTLPPPSSPHHRSSAIVDGEWVPIRDRVFCPVAPSERGETSHPKRRLLDDSVDADKVEVVVIVMAHDGVRIPAVWEELHSQARGRLDFVVYVEEGLGVASLTPFLRSRVLPPDRLPPGHTTGWAHPGVFEVMIVGMEFALEAYRHVHTLYVAPGNGMPIQPAAVFLDPSHSSTCLGIPLGSHMALPQWKGGDRIRNRALWEKGLPPLPAWCLGETFIRIIRPDAQTVVERARCIDPKDPHGVDVVRKLYDVSMKTRQLVSPPPNAPFQLIGPHDREHELTSPEEEFIPYLLHVLGKVKRRRTGQRSIMYDIVDEDVASTPLCRACKYTAGRAAVLTEGQVADSLTAARVTGCMFMRKVSADLSRAVWERAIALCDEE